MERLTQTSDKGGVAFTFDLDVICQPSEMKKILKIAEKLKDYEDLEEQGLLLRLPYKVGDTVYIIYSDKETSFIEEPIVKDVSTHRIWIESRCYDYSDIGKTIFLAKAEAEQKLKEMEG